MRLRIISCAALTALALVACGRGEQAANNATAETTAASAAPSTATTTGDDELDRLKATTPVDACTLLPPEKLKSVLPEVNFELVQRLEPQISGYAWDSRCIYGAGRGSIEFAKDQETHRVELYINTWASADKAEESLQKRRELDAALPEFSAQPELGKNAYATWGDVSGRVNFVRGQSEIHIVYRALNTSSTDMVPVALALAKAL
jgi:hypothetical protein